MTPRRVVLIVVAIALVAGLITGLALWLIPTSKAKTYKFPEDFKFGAASASYQIEGAWNVDGKSPSIWDTLVHTRPELIADGSNADVGADSYHFYKDDVKALKNAGVRIA
jgi:lipopolysaccharide export LptBFGC system permease protein LptF